jgi:DNA-binding NarL/FixJ family response regulator
VLTPTGMVEHADGDATTRAARERLREAVSALDRARGGLRRRDPDGAVDLWRVLVASRWSLVETFESDGRRYLVARVNEPRSGEFAPLTPREHDVLGYARMGHHNKLIAYELGLAPSTVRVLLSRAAAKLGATSRADLVARYDRFVTNATRDAD